MKYFTPELYLLYNSNDDKVADQAQESWDQAIDEYKRYLKDHRGKMPSKVRMLAEKCCFHDSPLLSWQTHEPSGSSKSASPRVLTLGLHQGNEMVVLYYFLTDSPKESRRPRNWPFSHERKHWLYDEIAITAAAVFMHQILWSDGSELAIPFADVIVDRFPSLSPAAGS